MAGAAAESDDLSLLIELAAQGDPTAQCRLAYRYEHGDGVVQDQVEALRLYTQAADQGLAVAQYNLGRCFFTGNGVVHDEKKAARLFRKAAKQGFAEAQHALGQCFKLGAGVVQDDEEAVKLNTLAAEQGFADAQYCLGHCFLIGRGCVKDEEEAVKLFRLAADQGLAAAQSSFGECCMFGLGVAHDLADSARYLRLAADQGIAGGQTCLGYMYEHGKGTKRDLAEAVRLYRAAAAQRDVRALARLGMCLEKGRGVAQSEAEAAASYAAASELGGADTLFADGVRHFNEVGKRSAPESFKLQLAVNDLALAARLGHAGAVEKLASISSRGELVSACCLGCGATRELRLCSRCRVAAFCDGDCTRRMWPAHKPCCKQWQADAAATEDTHPAVLEAAVVGIPDERLGERVVAVLAVLAACRPRLAGYKLPRALLWWPAEWLPRTASAAEETETAAVMNELNVGGCDSRADRSHASRAASEAGYGMRDQEYNEAEGTSRTVTLGATEFFQRAPALQPAPRKRERVHGIQNPVASKRHADGETTNELARSRSAGRPRVAWFGSFGSFFN
ncbi:hypothetical protein T492DRAFT_862602 [Pavlovales sp. CCMP2436]|nr:hypothetical protein T492DRAFT_862602 [Pavlovales sp. CCMP2436]